eukprot:m.243359 g.243359  ORF g.243359 m.243359 type:complete len:281 (-) comp43119_c0_seq1:10-852(-)
MEESVFCVVPSGWKSASIVTLPDPRLNGEEHKYLVCKDRGLFEMMKWDDDVPRSLFTGDFVKEDGSLFLPVSVDPLFLLLPFLKESRDKQNMYVQLEAIIPSHKYCGFRYFDEGSDLGERVAKGLAHVCDVRGAGDIRAYRLDDLKLMKWLKAKIMQIALEVEDDMLLTSSSTRRAVSFHSKLQFSYGALSSYLSDDLALAVRRELGLVVVEEKKDTMGKYAGMQAGVDYSDKGSSSGPPKKAPKLTAAQKQLQKVDKKGMKSIASFFGANKKKTNKNKK